MVNPPLSQQSPRKVLIFANGETNDGAMVRRALALAAPNPFVIAADGGARLVSYFGLTPNAIIGDMDSITAEALERGQMQGASILRYPPAKNETDLELALLYAVEQGAGWIRVIGAAGDRLDQTLSNIYLLGLPALSGCDVRLVAGKQEAWLMMAGMTTIEGAAGDTVSLIPLSGAVQGIRTEGLHYPLKHETLSFGPARGVSNVLDGTHAAIYSEDGILLIVHTIGRA